MARAVLLLEPSKKLALADLRNIFHGEVELRLDVRTRETIEKAQACVENVIERDDVVYGINTGFGKLANTRIPSERLQELQKNLVLSHSVGVGPLLDAGVVRLILATKAVSLARGHSGVRPVIVDALIALYNHGLLPQIPAKGSVGASGDLAPLAHMSCVLIGMGSCSQQGRSISGAEAISSIGMQPLVLGPKEGLALLNGTQVSTSLALAGLFDAESVFSAGMIAGALSLEAVKGSVKPFDERISLARGQHGQIKVAGIMRELLKESHIVASHADCGRVQDPYSLRCIPQVMGACLDSLQHAASVLEIEANAASDNPLIFPDTEEVISGGNFHAEPVAMAADLTALAIAEMGSLSERRLALLLDSHLSGLPAFLVKDSGVNSGFMIPQVTSAALVSENKCLAHPASVDSIPTSANQEDHVSMATYAARRLGDMTQNAATIIGIEAMAAAQGMEFHRPLTTSVIMESQFAAIRQRVTFLERDRYLADDVKSMCRWVLEGEWPSVIRMALPSHSANAQQ